MKKKHFFKSIFLVFCIILPSQKAFCLEKKYQEIVNSFKQAIQKGDRLVIEKKIKYPLKRSKPLPNIKSPEDFIMRYDQIFDHTLKMKIIHSDTSKDWSAVGWHGIMLEDGQLWLDYDGKITTINYMSEAEKDLKKDLLALEKQKLHKSLRKLKMPILDWKTKRFRVRIDETEEDSYRYASWSIKKTPLDKPNLILKNGEYHPDGSGGNHYYKFKSGDFVYKVHVTVIGGKTSPMGELEVLKDGESIVSEDFIAKAN